MTFPLHRLLVPFIWTVSIVIPCLGQQSAIRISPPESISGYSLPSEIRVQAAASLGFGTLVVWGSYETDRQGYERPVLRIQHLGGGIPDRPSAIAHSEAARPLMPIHLGATADGYNLYWHDRRRFEPGLYMRRFDRLGAPIGEERRVVAGAIADLLSYPSSDGLERMITVYRQSLSPLLLHSDGSIESNPLPEGRLAHGHIIHSDSSLIELLSHGICYYRHYLDAQPMRYHNLDSLGAISFTLTPDSSGRPVLTYITKQTDGSCAGAQFHQSVIADDGTISAPVGLRSESGCPPSGYTGYLDRVEQARMTGGYMRLRIIRRWYYGTGSGIKEERIENSDHYVGPRGGYALWIDPWISQRWGEEIVSRTRFDSITRVEVKGKGEVESIVAPVRAVRAENQPRLVSIGDSVYAVWNRLDPGSGAVNIQVMLARWPRVAEPNGQAIDFKQMRIGETRTDNGTRIAWSTWDVRTWAGGASELYKVDYYYKKFGSGTGGAGLRSIVATRHGLRMIDSMPMIINEAVWYLRPWAFDPNDRSSTIPVYWGPDIRRTDEGALILSVIDTTGAKIDTATVRGGDGFVIPVGRGERLLVQGSELRHVSGDSIDWQKPFEPVVGRELQLQRLFGQYFMRTWLDTSDRSLHVERFTLDGVPAGTFQSPTTSGAHHLSFALNPTDSSIVFVYGATHGVCLTKLAQDLRPIAVNRLAYRSDDSVAGPTALFHGGRLYVAWVDYRTDGGDILGMLVDETTLRAAEEPVVAGMTMTVAPNPSSDRVEVSIETEERDVVIDLIDLQGRTLQIRRAERTVTGVRATFDLSELPASTYIAVAHIGSTRVARRIIKR